MLKAGHDLPGAGYFSPDQLPPLWEDRILKSQRELVCRKVREDDFSVFVD
jgi:hypothetical protein